MGNGVIRLRTYFSFFSLRRYTWNIPFCTSLADSLGVGSMWGVDVFALEVEGGIRIRITIMDYM